MNHLLERLITKELKGYWEFMLKETRLKGTQIDSEFEAWWKKMNQPELFYHNVYHVLSMLNFWKQHKSQLNNPHSILWAIFFHDFEVNSNAKQSISKSVRALRNMMQKAKFAEKDILRVTYLIECTAQHQGTDQDTDLNFFLDFDLAILGSSEGKYDQYKAQIHQEHPYVPWLVFRFFRIRFLKEMLKRDRIFKTDEFFTAYEAKARLNMTRELEGGYFFEKLPPDPYIDFKKNRLAFEKQRQQLVQNGKSYVGAIFCKGLFITYSEQASDTFQLEEKLGARVYNFPIIPEAEEIKRWKEDSTSIWDLLGNCFLDTDTSFERHHLESVLSAKGISAQKVQKLLKVAGLGLWWNCFWWEWDQLGKKDLLTGWRLNYLPALLIFLPSMLLILPITWASALTLIFLLGYESFVRYWTRYLDRLNKSYSE